MDAWDTYFGTKQTIKLWEADASNNIIYEGKAEVGTDTDENRWLIRKYTWSGTVATAQQWAPFNSIWDNRASLTYS